MRTRHNIMLYVYCQPVYFRCWRHKQTVHSVVLYVCYLSLGFCSSSVDVCTFLGCGAASVDDLYPTFRERVAVSYSRVKMPSDFRTWKIRHPGPITRWLSTTFRKSEDVLCSRNTYKHSLWQICKCAYAYWVWLCAQYSKMFMLWCSLDLVSWWPSSRDTDSVQLVSTCWLLH